MAAQNIAEICVRFKLPLIFFESVRVKLMVQKNIMEHGYLFKNMLCFPMNKMKKVALDFPLPSQFKPLTPAISGKRTSKNDRNFVLQLLSPQNERPAKTSG